jgi:hypothetical protein
VLKTKARKEAQVPRASEVAAWVAVGAEHTASARLCCRAQSFSAFAIPDTATLMKSNLSRPLALSVAMALVLMLCFYVFHCTWVSPRRCAALRLPSAPWSFAFAERSRAGR